MAFLAALAGDRVASDRLGRRATAGAAGWPARTAGFVSIGILLVAISPGTGSLSDIASWWADPVVYQKFAIWGLLWELLGSGSRHWLQPGTVRLPPWPGKVAFTAGTRRTVPDVVLYVVAVALAAVLLLGPAPHGALPRGLVWTLLGALTVLGLRDRTPVLAARPDVYGVLLLVFAFPPQNLVFATKLVLAGWWWSRAVARLNRHFPAVIALDAMGSPWRRVALFDRAARRLWAGPDSGLRASAWSSRLAASAVAVEFGLPLVLLLARGGAWTVVGVALMVAYQLLSISMFRAGSGVGVAVFLGYSTLAIFGHHAGVGQAGFTSWTLTTLLLVLLAGVPLLAALYPDLLSPLVSRRRGSGTEAASLWLFRDDAGASDVLADRQLALRTMASHSGAPFGLIGRAVDQPSDYRAQDGELVAATVLGCSLGDGHLHGEALLDALRERNDFPAGQLRLITLSGQNIRGRVGYRITDAASGKLEEGTISRSELRAYRPLAADSHRLPTTVTFRVLPPMEVPKVVAAARPRPRPAGGSGHVRLGADGTIARVRPRPTRTTMSPRGL